MNLKIKEAWTDKSNIYVRINTGHTIGTFGESIHWPELDVDIQLQGVKILQNAY